MFLIPNLEYNIKHQMINHIQSSPITNYFIFQCNRIIWLCSFSVNSFVSPSPAIYCECLIQAVPFFACNSWGFPELIMRPWDTIPSIPDFGVTSQSPSLGGTLTNTSFVVIPGKYALLLPITVNRYLSPGSSDWDFTTKAGKVSPWHWINFSVVK